MAYVEKEKRTKLDNKAEKTIYLGMSSAHSDDTAKLLSLKTKQIIYRRNVYYNERSFPARKQKLKDPKQTIDTGEDLLGLQFFDEGQWWTIKDHGTHDNEQVLWYTKNDTKEEEKSSVKEVREWYNQTQVQQAATHLVQASNQLAPPKKGFINILAEQVYKTIKTYDVKLPTSKHVKKPTSFKKAANSPYAQWFAAEEKEKDGMLQFQTWDRLDQQQLTSEIRRRALRCHHLYDIKRDQSAKNRVVANGSRQHSDTYSDTTSPVVGQLLLRLFLTVTAFRQYKC